MRIGEILKNQQSTVFYKLNMKKKRKRKHKKNKMNFKDYENLMKQGNVYKRCKGGSLRQIK